MTVRKCCRKIKKEVVPNFQVDDNAKTSTNAPSQTDRSLVKSHFALSQFWMWNFVAQQLFQVSIAGYIAVTTVYIQLLYSNSIYADIRYCCIPSVGFHIFTYKEMNK